MLIDRNNLHLHMPWIVATLVVAALATAWFVFATQWDHDPPWPSGGSTPGLIFGILGGGICLFEFALWPRMQRISSEVLMRAVFGTVETENLVRLRELLRTLTSWLNDPRRLALLTTVGSRWLSHNAGFRAVMDPVEAAVLEEVRRRRCTQEPERDDILSMLERAHDGVDVVHAAAPNTAAGVLQRCPQARRL